MAVVEVKFYADDDGDPLALTWLRSLSRDLRAQFGSRITGLQNLGPNYGPPLAKPLGKGLWELRVREGRVNFRLLYFFEAASAVLSHGLTKEGKIPPHELKRAKDHQVKFKANPTKHTWKG